MLRYLPVLLYVGLVIYALADMTQRPDKAPYGVPKWGWAVIIVVVPVLGAGAWIALSKFYPDQPTQGRTRPSAPDDDPEYLAWLRDQARRRRQSGEEQGR